ncbi:MAG TPA: ABC transporter ATP-binding protein [Erysipelothrix sp.]
MIQIENLSKQFGTKTLFQDFNLTINAGEMVAIIGKSGSGKSTLLNIMGAIEPYDQGKVCIDDIDLGDLKGKHLRNYLKNTVTFIFQNYAMMYDKTVIDNILLLKDQQADIDKALEALKIVDLEGFENRPVDELSGGEQQRVALARALVRDTKVILADEPTGNLDEENEALVYKILKAFSKEGKTVIVATHDLKYLDQFDRVIDLTV